MKHSEQVNQIKLLMARLDSGTTVDAGGFRLNPTSVYTDPDLAAREWAEFFTSHPQVIGCTGDLPEPNSFFTLRDLGVPMLATRDSQGRFRAFINSCRHRGAVVEERDRGTTRRFACPFHNWTYDTGGALVGVPHSDQFGDIDLECHGLVELPADEKYGLLFVHPQVDGTIDVDELLGDELAEELASWRFDEFAYLGNDTYEVACNWKLAMDTFGETYHFNTLHQNTLVDEFYGNIQAYDTFGRNHRMLLVKRSIDSLRGLPEDEWDITTATLPGYWLFPNAQLLPYAQVCFLVRAYPDPADPRRHTSRITFYVRPELIKDDDLRSTLDFMARRFGNIIRDEDYAASVSQQVTADSGRLDHVVFGRNEPALHHYHNTYRAALGMDPLPLLDHID